MGIDRQAIPPAVWSICAALRTRGHDAYLVGGAVRDLLRGVRPQDWDVATAARPEEVLEAFPGSLPTGLKYGTVTVRRDELNVEVTTFRGEGSYGDGRHPDEVAFGLSVEEDLARRDFTINALAFDPLRGTLVDPFGGLRDLRSRRLRTVGAAEERFREDALRMLRFYRFQAVLGFRPDGGAVRAIQPDLLRRVSQERIRDELGKLLPAPYAGGALRGLASTGLLAVFLPEAAACAAVAQGWFHRHDVLEHSIRAVETIRPELRLRLAAFLHDIGKPPTRTADGRGGVHFHGHDVRGGEMAEAALTRMHFPGDFAASVARLIRLHMFQLPPHPTEAALRRLLQKAGGPGGLRELLELRRADIVATGRLNPLGARYWSQLRNCAEEVIAAGGAFSLRHLAVDGWDVMQVLGLPPGPEVGRILKRLLEKVIEDPALNERARLEEILRRGEF
ncbi:MAG: CCA tRNA nucleotidyltransferase [Bacteroidota bacterium]